MSKQMAVGDFAPDFILKDQHGSLVKLSDYKNKSNVVLFFYPKDDTPGCTAEVCSFRDNYEGFKSSGAEVIGISSDDSASHFKFAAKHHLPYTLLSDHGGKVRKLFGVPTSLIFLPGRVTYIIDKQGVIRHVFNSQLNVTKHVDEAMKMLATI